MSGMSTPSFKLSRFVSNKLILLTGFVPLLSFLSSADKSLAFAKAVSVEPKPNPRRASDPEDPTRRNTLPRYAAGSVDRASECVFFYGRTPDRSRSTRFAPAGPSVLHGAAADGPTHRLPEAAVFGGDSTRLVSEPPTPRTATRVRRDSIRPPRPVPEVVRHAEWVAAPLGSEPVQRWQIHFH